ncbi:unnamed protein product [Rotaria sp. Silwood1]|nr:unnamed protein product [Rotaria sp. Silwood1]
MSSTALQKQQNTSNDKNNLYLQLIQLLDVNENGRLVLPFSRRLILIDRPYENSNANAWQVDNNMSTDSERTPSEVSSSTSQSYLSSDEENNSEHNTTFVSMSLPPSPFLCDPYESYDWEYFDITDARLVKLFYDLNPTQEQISSVQKIWRAKVKSCKQTIRRKKKYHSSSIMHTISMIDFDQDQQKNLRSIQSFTTPMQKIIEARLTNIEERTQQLMKFIYTINDNVFF